MARKRKSRLHGFGALSTGAKVGVGVGLAALLGGGIWWFMRRRRTRGSEFAKFRPRGPIVDMSSRINPAVVAAHAASSIPGSGMGTKDMY